MKQAGSYTGSRALMSSHPGKNPEKKDMYRLFLCVCVCDIYLFI